MVYIEQHAQNNNNSNNKMLKWSKKGKEEQLQDGGGGAIIVKYCSINVDFLNLFLKDELKGIRSSTTNVHYCNTDIGMTIMSHTVIVFFIFFILFFYVFYIIFLFFILSFPFLSFSCQLMHLISFSYHRKKEKSLFFI